MMVESMSATNSLRQRGSLPWTNRSTPSRASSAQRALRASPAKAKSAASPSSIHSTNRAAGSSSRSNPSARSISLSSRRPAAISVAMVIASDKPPLALIAGPTASGKSALALALAERIGGAIVNADSAQVYRDLPVLSAAPSESDRDRADHRLYGFRDAAAPCSAAAWADLAKAGITALHSQGRLPILAGGTGLYLRTLLY